VRSQLYRNGQLLRSFRGEAANVPGFTDDYAFLIQALIGICRLHNTHKYMAYHLWMFPEYVYQYWNSNGAYCLRHVRGVFRDRVAEVGRGTGASRRAFFFFPRKKKFGFISHRV
jgi:uncharacterized protein YyaL (SSP411 family)